MSTFAEFIVLATKLWWPAWVGGIGLFALCCIAGQAAK